MGYVTAAVTRRAGCGVLASIYFATCRRLMRELVDADSAILPIASSSEGNRNTRRSHASKQKCQHYRNRGMVEVLHLTRRKNLGKNLELLREKRMVSARKKRREKRATWLDVRIKHKNKIAQSKRSRAGSLVITADWLPLAETTGIRAFSVFSVSCSLSLALQYRLAHKKRYFELSVKTLSRATA